MLQIDDTSEVARDISQSTATETNNIATGTTMATGTQEGTSTGVISTPKAADTISVAPTQDQTTAIDQNTRPWHGGWTAGGNPWTGRWGGMPGTIITFASTVTYTEPPSTAEASQISPAIPKPSESRMEGIDVSGPVAAGIGVGASVGLLGLCLVVAYFYKKRSRGQWRQSSSLQTSEGIKGSDGIWPKYPYSASNESPIELSASRPPKELDTVTRLQQQDLSNNSELVELDGNGMVNSRSQNNAFLGL